MNLCHDMCQAKTVVRSDPQIQNRKQMYSLSTEYNRNWPHVVTTNSLLESREVAVDRVGTEVVDKRQVFTYVLHWPAIEERVQQALVSS